MTNNQPETKFQAGAIAATIWKNQTLDKEGHVREFRTVSFDRRYQNDRGEWKSTNSLRINDLPKAAAVLQKAYEYIVLKDEGDAPQTAQPQRMAAQTH